MPICSQLQHAPPEAYLEVANLPYYGSEDPWDRRFFQERIGRDESRTGQTALLHIMEGRAARALAYCQELIDAHSGHLEAHFVKTIAHCQMGEFDGAVQAMEAALNLGLPFERFIAGPRSLLAPLYETDAFRDRYTAYRHRLVHGPLLGAVTDRSISIWVRTPEVAEVRVEYWRIEAPGGRLTSEGVNTSEGTDFTAVIRLAGLAPDTRRRQCIRRTGMYPLLNKTKSLAFIPRTFYSIPDCEPISQRQQAGNFLPNTGVSYLSSGISN